MSRILVVDDEREIADLIAIHLRNEGYEVSLAYGGAEAIALALQESFDLLILDIMMPGVDGLQICRRIRQKHNTPIIFLSARSEDMDKILGLSAGADDYMTKPFNVLELVARVKAQLRRFLMLNPAAAKSCGTIAVANLLIDKDKHAAYVNDQLVNLTPTEFGILYLLASNPGRVFSSEEIFTRVWSEPYLQASNTVMVHIRKLREKIEANPQQPVLIKTVWGIGYKLEASN